MTGLLDADRARRAHVHAARNARRSTRWSRTASSSSSREQEQQALDEYFIERARRHRPDAGDGAHHAAVQLRVRLLLPGRPRRLQQVRRQDDARDGGRRRRAGSTKRLDEVQAGEVRAHALRRRAAAEPAGRPTTWPSTATRCARQRGVAQRDQHHHQRTAADAGGRRAAATRTACSGVKITLDGDRDTHNRMRPLRGGQGTFDRIIENVRRVAPLRADHDRRQLRRGVGRQLSGAARLPAASRSSPTDIVKINFKPIIKSPEPAAPKGFIPLTVVGGERQAAERHLHDERGRRARRGGAVRHLPLRRREDAVPARRDAQARASTRRTASTWVRARSIAGTPTRSARRARSTRAPDSPATPTESTGHIDGRDEAWRHAAAERFERLTAHKEECGDCSFIPVCGGGCSVAAHTELGDMHQPSCHKGAMESALVSLAQRTAASAVVNQPLGHSTRSWSKLMKITVIKKASTVRKPQNFCPWVTDDDAPTQTRSKLTGRRRVAPVVVSFERRTALSGWCGVFLCARRCRRLRDGPIGIPTRSRDSSRIGFPEGHGAADRRRASARSPSTLTLEGLTQLGADGRADAATRRRAGSGRTTGAAASHAATGRRPSRRHDRWTRTLAAEDSRRRSSQIQTTASCIPALGRCRRRRGRRRARSWSFTSARHSSCLPEDLSIPLGIRSDTAVSARPVPRRTARRSRRSSLERFDRYYLGTPDDRAASSSGRSRRCERPGPACCAAKSTW